MIGVEIVFLCVFFDCVTVLCLYVSLGNGLACLRLVVSNFDCVTAIGYLNLSGIWQVKIVGKNIVHTLVTLVFSVRSFTDSFVRALYALPLITPPRLCDKPSVGKVNMRLVSAAVGQQLDSRHFILHDICVCVCVFPLNQTWTAR